MSLRNWLTTGIAVLALGMALWMYLDNRELRKQLAEAGASSAEKNPWESAPKPTQLASRGGSVIAPTVGLGGGKVGDGPELSAKRESVMARRVRITEEIAAMFGRLDGETEEEYRARVAPMIEGALQKPRKHTANRRRDAEEAAGVTAEQSAKIDKALEKVYAEVVDYTNGAISNGQVSPYRRDVGSLLEFAGGLGTMLNGAQSSIGKILSAEQMKTMYDMGFEWGEYLGVSAPWEQLRPPPPP